jgi:S1-C subfamily serine protease
VVLFSLLPFVCPPPPPPTTTYVLLSRASEPVLDSSELGPSLSTQVTLMEESATTDAVSSVSPSVVTIINDLAPRRGLFGRGYDGTASGSGVIVDNRGFIVTNEHVVKDSDGLDVILADGTRYTAQLVGTDYPFTDLAVIKIEADNLVAAELGDSDALTQGQRVIAIGSALGDFRNTVTMGIVSGLHRTWHDNGQVIEDLVQTDAAINHGNSGGPLVNIAGQVVGINSSVIRSTKGGDLVDGIGFAIPSNTVRVVASQLIKHGKVVRPYLGVSHQRITPGLASLYNLPVKQGAYILQVGQTSPAGVAGMKPGDILLKIGGESVDEEHPFLNVLMKYSPDETVTLTVMRQGELIEVDVLLTERR